MKISFDFDGCLTLPRIQQIARDLVLAGHEVYIVTSRLDTLKRLRFPNLKDNADLFAVAKSIGIPPWRVGFTNQQQKWMSLHESGIKIHIDNDDTELHDLKYYDKVKGLSCFQDDLEEALYEYIDLLN